MKNIIVKTILVVAMIVSFPLMVWAEKNPTDPLYDDKTRARMGEIKDETRFHKAVDESAKVYRLIVKGEQGQVPKEIVDNARCIAILPNVFTGALIVGGTGGNGLVSCKADRSGWSQPAAISLRQGSIGLQAGAKSADLVMFMLSEEAESALKSGKLSLGADISAVAGRYDASVDTTKAGVVVYSHAEGAFAGASVTGSQIAIDKKALQDYYGKNVDPVDLLVGKVSPDADGYANKLTSLFP